MSKRRITAGIRSLAPSYFGLPMSTGIIAIGSLQMGHPAVGRAFFALNHVEMLVLGALFLMRLLFFFPAFRRDLGTHGSGAGFLTIVAAVCLLGMQYIVFNNAFRPAAFLWCLALVAWAVLAYSFFILISIKTPKPSLAHGLNGTWLLFVVSVQALSILGATLAPQLPAPVKPVLFITLLFHLLGWLFYLIIIGIIFLRTTFIHLDPTEFRPSYWINMGAAAITTLAGITLARSLAEQGSLVELVPPLKFFIVFAWVAGTWWVPVVFTLGLWRNRKVPLRYHAGHWSLVFPLGMLTVCTWELVKLFELPLLAYLPKVLLPIAWAAWTLAFIAMCTTALRRYVLAK